MPWIISIVNGDRLVAGARGDIDIIVLTKRLAPGNRHDARRVVPGPGAVVFIERGHDVTVYTTGRTVPTEEESPWWYDGTIRRLEGGVDSAEDVDATLTEAYGGPRRAEMSRAA